MKIECAQSVPKMKLEDHVSYKIVRCNNKNMGEKRILSVKYLYMIISFFCPLKAEITGSTPVRATS